MMQMLVWACLRFRGIGRRAAMVLVQMTCAVALPLAAHAQSDYPNRPVRILSPHTPGMGTDAALRGMAQVLGEKLGQPFVVENRAGADGLLAGAACAKAPPDGYTLCMGDSLGITLNPLVRVSMPYDPATAFTPITLLTFMPGGIWVNAAVPAKNYGELLAYARANPGKVNLATTGRSSPAYLFSRLLLATQGIQFNEVPYKSAGEAWRAVLAGEVDVATFTVGSGLQQAQSRARLVAVSTSARVPEAPDVPTYGEVGLVSVITWMALFAPTGTPEPILERINATLAKEFYAKPDLVARFIETPGYLNQGIAGMPLAAAGDFMKQQRSMYLRLVQDAKIPRE